MDIYRYITKGTTYNCAVAKDCIELLMVLRLLHVVMIA